MNIAFWSVFSVFTAHIGIVLILSAYIWRKFADREPESLSDEYKIHQIQAPPAVIRSSLVFLLGGAGLYILWGHTYGQRLVYIFILYLYWGYKVSRDRSEAKKCLELDAQIDKLKGSHIAQS